MMLSLDGVTRTELKQLEYGSLFVPIVETGSRFLAGRLNDYELLIVLDGEKPFSASERHQWSRGAGIQVPGIRFEAETGDASRVDGTRKGMLLLSGDQIGIAGYERSDPFPVWIFGDGKSGGESAIGFRKWRIVRGSGAEKQILFEGAAI
jgi:hypothetical protein